MTCTCQRTPDHELGYGRHQLSSPVPCTMSICPLVTGISQRDYTQYYQHISKQEDQISQSIQEFFSQHIQYNFLDEDCECWALGLNQFD